MARFYFVCVLFSFVCVPFALSLGGWRDVASDNQRAKAAVRFAVDNLGGAIDSVARYRLLKTSSIERRTTSVWMWKVHFNVAETTCDKTKPFKNWASCPATRLLTCKAEVWDQVWNDVRELKTAHCAHTYQKNAERQVGKKILVGGKEPAKVDDPEMLKAAQFAVDDMNAGSNQMFNNGLGKIISATRQVVAGMLYKLEIEVGPTGCRNGIKTVPANCQLAENGERQTCTVVIWDQAWRTPRYKMMTSKCSALATVNHGSPYAHNSVIHMHQTSKQQAGHDDMYTQFLEFKEKYGKSYTDKSEHLKRFEIFKQNMKKVKKIQLQEKGSARYGATEFADIPEEEFRKNYLSPIWKHVYDPKMKEAQIPKATIPAAWDWRDHNAVSEVKNQGSCGSCWAFSTTGNIEGQWAIKKKQLISLSEQELVDCDKVDLGCNGGLPSQAYKQIIKLGGLETEKEYPYEAEGETCHFKKSDVRVYINGSVNISSNEAEMAAWLYKNGPISIGINAFAMQFYFGGIAHPWSMFCNPSSLDHGVLIVGYATKGSTPYWIIKNSWGGSWGEKGYYLVYRGGGVCGLNRMCTSATVA